MKYILKNKEIELTEDEVKEIIKQNTTPKEEKVVGIAIKDRWTGEIIFQSTKTTYKEAIQEKGDANLRDADLGGVDLTGVNFTGVNLTGANLSDANLCDANFTSAYLIGANLSYANLRGANFTGADLNGVDLRYANLRDAEMCGAKFHGKTSSPKTLTKNQLPDFLNALGFELED